MQSTQDAIPTHGLNLKQAALVAGFAYVLNPVTFAEGYVMPRLMSADPAQTVANLTAHPHLFLQRCCRMSSARLATWSWPGRYSHCFDRSTLP